MTDVIIVISNITFIITIFKFTEHIFGRTKAANKQIIVMAVLNNFLYLIFYYYFPYLNLEIVLLLVYFFIYFFEFKILYNQLGNRVILFGVLSFLLVHFSGRLLVTALCSLQNGQSMQVTYNNEFYNIIINLVPVLTAIPYIIIITKFLHKEKFDMIFTDKTNLNFIIGMLSFTLVYLAFLLTLTSTNQSSKNFILFYALSSFIIFLCIHLSIIYSYFFARLKLHVTHLSNINQQVLLEKQEIGDITNRSNYDPMSGFCVRTIAEEQIEMHLKNNVEFFVVFIDIDGLKTVNDFYGHSEGDFYIKAVCELIRTFFDVELVSRLGGDEFLVVGTGIDIYDINKKIMQTYDKIKKIKTVFKKTYQTSISYGVVTIQNNSHRTVKDIISEADEKMYDFKKSKKRQRT